MFSRQDAKSAKFEIFFFAAPSTRLRTCFVRFGEKPYFVHFESFVVKLLQKNMRPIIERWIAVAALFLALATAPLAVQAQMKVRVNWSAIAGNQSGVWVAHEEGFFKRNGLDVELMHVPSSSRAIQTMLAGEIAFSYVDGRTAVQSNLRGAEVVMLAAVVNRHVFSFMARPEIKRVSDLKGKKIGVTRIGSTTHTIALYVTSQAGLKAEEYQILPLVEVPNILTALLAGQIDAGPLSPPTNIRARKAGLNELINLARDGPEYVSVALGSTRSYIKANEEITRRVIRSYVEAVHHLKGNKEVALRVIQKYARIKEPEILEATYGEVREYLESVPYVSRKGLEAVLADLVDAEPKARQAKPEDFLDARFVAQLEKEGLFRKLPSK
jgi:ABC-type nitrate/sulfonate/bicarbonate transport system substrate-binding protein